MTYFTGSSGQQRVPKSYLQNLEIPLPETKIQKSISDKIYKKKEQIKKLKQQAEQNIIAANPVSHLPPCRPRRLSAHFLKLPLPNFAHTLWAYRKICSDKLKKNLKKSFFDNG